MKLATPIAFLLLAATGMAAAQETQQPSAVTVEGSRVSISAKGDDVRSVLFDLFRQSGQNFVLDAGVRWVLYLHLEEVGFQEALDIVVENAEIGYELKNGVYYIGKNRPKPSAKPAVQPKPTTQPKPTPAQPEHSAPAKVTDADLQKHLTTRYSVTPIRKVFEEFSRQTGIKIEVDASVPDYKLDAYLIDTSLKYALDVICDAAKLRWVKTDRGTILIEKAS